MTIDYSTGEITEPLTDDETARLRRKERVIERSAGEVAQALAAIRDERLYRAEHSTFEAYCRERWGMTRQHANRQIVAAEVAAALEPMGSNISERQARELADLRDDPEQLRETYQRASVATDGNVTAAAIREARQGTPRPKAVDLDEQVRTAVHEFPDLAYYASTGPDRDVLNMADDLRRFRERGELDMRLDNLRRAIAVDKAKRAGTYRPGTTAVMDDDGEYRMTPIAAPTSSTRTCPTCSGRGVIQE